MRVAILGCGAMGTIMGAFMTKNGIDVTMIDSYKAHVDALNEKGAKIIGFADFTVPVHAITPEQMEGIYDLVFLFTKQTANDEVLPNLLPHLGPDSTVCTLQNGVPEPYVAKYVGQNRTVGGTVLWSGTFIEPGVSQLTQNVENLAHFFGIGEMDGQDTERIHKVAEVLGHMGNADVSPSLMAERWSKLINNACMSGMSAAAGLTFGGVLENDKARACLSYLGNEVMRCAEAEGYNPPAIAGKVPTAIFKINNQEEYNRSQTMFWKMYQYVLAGKASMLQDLEKNRKTEVPMINGYVCEAGRKHGIPTPFCDKVVEIVKKIEAGEEKLGPHCLDYFEDSMFTYEPFKPEV